jgi:hypothetical protein
VVKQLTPADAAAVHAAAYESLWVDVAGVLEDVERALVDPLTNLHKMLQDVASALFDALGEPCRTCGEPTTDHAGRTTRCTCTDGRGGAGRPMVAHSIDPVDSVIALPNEGIDL